MPAFTDLDLRPVERRDIDVIPELIDDRARWKETSRSRNASGVNLLSQKRELQERQEKKNARGRDLDN